MQLLDILNKLEKASYRASKEPKFFEKQQSGWDTTLTRTE